MKIDEALITYLQDLSRIRLGDEEKARAMKDLGNILEHMKKLDELDTEGLQGLSHPFPQGETMRADARMPSAEREAILKNAPRQKDGNFVAPKTIG